MKRGVFVGSKQLGARVLRAIHAIAPQHLSTVVTLDDASDGRCALAEFKRFSKETSVPLHILSKGSDLGGVVASCAPDVGMVVGWYSLLRPDVLRMARDGWLGIHASLLPRYRGGAPLVWSLINGERESGVSLFYFDEGMDSGDIVAQKRFAIGCHDTIADALTRVEDLSVEIVNEYYPLVIRGAAPRTPQDHSQATCYAIRTPADGKITWMKPGAEIHNFIRAQTRPYPGAFCTGPSGERLRVWSAAPVEQPVDGAPGQVVMIDETSAVVACGGKSALRVHAVQCDGHGEQNAGTLLAAGERLG